MVTRRKKSAESGNEQDLEAALEQLREDLQTLQKDVRAIAGEAGSAATERLSEALAGALGSVEGIRARVENWGEANMDSVREAVRQQPLQSCMIAFGVGTLLGILLRR